MNPLLDEWKGRTRKDLLRMVYLTASIITLFVYASSENVTGLIISLLNLLLASRLISQIKVEE